MAINIQSLFSDIIETPAQRQERMLTEGIVRGRELTRGLTGLAATQAPLVAALSQQMPRRQDALRRGVGGMLGLDVRTESEKVQDALRGVDPSDPQSLISVAQRVGNLGLGAQAAQLRGMAAEVTRQKQQDARAQREDVRRQQEFALGSTAALQEIQAREETMRQARESEEEQDTLRQSMVDMVKGSKYFNDQEKTDYERIILAGGYDGRMSELENLTSGRPLTYGSSAIQKTADGWRSLGADESDPNQLGKIQGLINSAALQYGSQTPEFGVVRDNIINGNISDAGDFKDYAALPEEAGTPNIPNLVEKEVQRYQQASTSAGAANTRIEDAIQIIFDNNLLQSGSAGLASDFFEVTKTIAGKRDEESFLRTAYTREKNTEIINSLPPGVASDRDIAIFSEGFPPGNAQITEILAFLQAAQRINSLVQDESLLVEQHIIQQRESGEFQDVTMLGFEQKRIAYGQARKELRRTEEVLDMQVQSLEKTQDQAYEEMTAELEGFRTAFGFVPTIYRNQMR